MSKLIAVVGMSGTGKSIATDYLENQGWTKIYFGGAVYDRMRKQGIEITPASQKEFRENLRKEYGMAAVAEILKDDIEAAYKKGDTVLDGLYSWEEYLTLKEKFPELVLLCIVTDKKTRYQRVGIRADRPFNHDEIIIRDLSEIENLNKGGPIAYADYFIQNNGNINQYIKRLNEILKMIDNKGEQ